MATINISELRPAGSELFQDSESFLNELSDREMGNLLGGSGGSDGGGDSILNSVDTGTSVTATSVDSGHVSITNPSGK